MWELPIETRRKPMEFKMRDIELGDFNCASFLVSFNPFCD
jgi:hypothetical protein